MTDQAHQGNRHNPQQWEQIRTIVAFAMHEDIGSGDITAQLCGAEAARATVICNENGVLCGQDWFNEAFRQLDPCIVVEWNCEDGAVLQPGQVVCTIAGPANRLLTGERTALNFLQTLSGTATFTREMLAHVPLPTKLLDTRKTIPGLRYAQKYAVRCAGAHNHRMGLFDAYLIKENHIMACGSIAAAVDIARKQHAGLSIEVEVETLKQLQEAIDCNVDIALLDNFTSADLEQAVELNHGRIKLEISGGVSYEQLQHYANIGADYISMGALTKHVHALDFSMRFITDEQT